MGWGGGGEWVQNVDFSNNFQSFFIRDPLGGEEGEANYL